jgi:hypothetical protein
MLEMGNQSEWGELPSHQTGTVVASIGGERSILIDIEVLGIDQGTTICGRVGLDTTRNLGSLCAQITVSWIVEAQAGVKWCPIIKDLVQCPLAKSLSATHFTAISKT